MVTCPTMNVAMPRPLATREQAAAALADLRHAPRRRLELRQEDRLDRIDDERARPDLVEGSQVTSERSFSAQRRSPSPPTPRRSARSLTCAATPPPRRRGPGGPTSVRARAAWRSKVLLPAPGSPPISTSEPLTRPPPRTRSSSPMRVGSRSPASLAISLRAHGPAGRRAPRPRAAAGRPDAFLHEGDELAAGAPAVGTRARLGAGEAALLAPVDARFARHRHFLGAPAARRGPGSG